MKVIEDIRYGNEENDFIDIFCPDGDVSEILIWFHGGGFEGGNRKNPPFAEDLTEKGIAVISVEYRLYPNAVFPEFITDCARAVKYIIDHITAKEEGKRVFVSGQSAGAYITLMLALNKAYLRNAGVDRSMISGFISESAQITVHYNILRERGVDTRLERIDEAAPIYHLSEDSDFRNLLIIYYTDDIPCRPEQNILFYKSAKRICPNQRVEIAELPGGHCNGSTNKNTEGVFDFNRTALNFINSI